jgi:glycerol uptake operon antiterminator
MTEIRGIVPAVNDFTQLRRFMDSEYPLCVIMNRHIASLEKIARELQEGSKRALVHCDLIHGLSPDEYGAEYLCGRFRPAGVISIRPGVIAACKRLGVTAIQRAFLIDSSALAKSLAAIEKAKPDYVELLPALCTPLFPMLKEKIDLPLIAGGLIQSKDMALEILQSGVQAVTISMDKLMDR